MREPDFSGVAKVWKVNKSLELEAKHISEWGYVDSTLATYLVNGPFHPFWSWWHVALVHLRETPGAPPPHLQYPEAQYEIMCLTLNPDPEEERPKIPDLEKLEAGDIHGGLPGFLHPADWAVQFHGVSDEQAVEIIELVARTISRGQSCDSDFRSWWESSIKTTVDHYARGWHK